MSKYLFEEIVLNSTKKKKPVQEDKYTYLGLEHLDPGRLQVTRYGADVAPIGEKLIMKKGDVLFGKRRAYQKKVAIAPFDGIFSAHGMVLRPKEEVIDRNFFPLFISSDYFLDAAIKISVGSLSPTINWSNLKRLEFELPEMDRQRKLAKVLWAIDAAKNSYQKLLLKTNELIKSQFIEMFGNPLINDKGWPTKRMSEVAPSTPYKGKIEDGNGECWLLNLDMVEANTGRILEKVKVPLDEIGTSTTTFSAEYVLYSKLRPYLNKVVVPDECGYATTELIPLKPDLSIVTQTFLSSLLRGDEFLSFIETQVSGTKMPRVTMNVFWDFEVILPPIELQHKFEKFVHQSNKTKFELEQTIKTTEALYRRILNENLG